MACGWRRLGIWPTNPGLFPKALGVVLIAATVCYLVDLLAAFLAPDLAKAIHSFIVIIPAIAEIWMVFYLLDRWREDREASQVSNSKRSPTQANHHPSSVEEACCGLAGSWRASLLLLMAGAIYESLSEAADARAYPPPGQMVDVGGYRLHINCTGEGSPTVVIDAGLGDWSTSWGLVQPEVAKTTRVCTYDRAGMGWSEPGPLPRDAHQIAGELHTLLQNANIPGPYVMVGHSFGGLPVQVFVHDYPAEVAGVVLIESMYPGPEDLRHTKPDASRLASVLARFGIVRLLARPLGLAADVPSDQAAYDALSVRPQIAASIRRRDPRDPG